MEVRKNSPKAWLLAARPKTLTGAAVPVLIALALAWADIHAGRVADAPDFNWTAAVLCLLFAFIMQIDANFVNDYFDYIRGTDDRATRLGPERACTQGWVSIGAMRWAIALTTVTACCVGLPLVLVGGWQMVVVGAVCVLFCFLYTTHLSYIGLGDVLVLLFFGVVPVCVTYYLQCHAVSTECLVSSIACGIVIDALLLVNNFRDRDTDRVAGKRTLVVLTGERVALLLYAGVGVAACLMGTIHIERQHEWAFLLPLLYLPLHTSTYLKMRRIWKGRGLNRCLGETARNIFIYGLLTSAGLLI